VRLLEIGTSAALNLRLDRYWYEQGGVGWGDPETAVRFVDLWAPDRPPFESGAVVAVRRGCDRDPIDASGPDASDASLTLLSYVWPGQDARFETLRAALAIAATLPITVDRADAVEWVPSQLAEPQAGLVTVVMHSVFWQYLSPESQQSIVASLATAGERATADAPLAWLRLEPSASGNSLELRLTTWPGNDEALLAKAGFHAGRVTWLG
jgi:hypothetical protein